MNKFLISLIVLFTMWNNLAIAAMYRWVDEKGQTHYTQHPPKTGEVTKMPPPLKAASTAEEESKRFLDLDKKIEAAKKEGLEAKQKQQQLDLKQKAKHENCQRAKTKYASLKNSTKYRDELGNVTVLTHEGKKSALEKAKTDVLIFCEE